jgi:transcriptional regulator with XRE-family HTH domain
MRVFTKDRSFDTLVEERLAMLRVGEEVRRLRKSRGLSIAGLGKVVGLSHGLITDVELGRRRLTKLDAVGKALGVSTSHFMRVAGHCTHCNGTGFAVGES